MKPGIKILIASAVLLAAGGVYVVMAQRSEPAGKSDSVPADKPLASYQVELLDLAFRAATAMPVDPHIKDRSRVQELVVSTCLELGQPNRALRYIEKIDNWRRGAGYANVALYCAQHGGITLQRYLDLASQIADEGTKDPDGQAWRRDRIRAIIAQTYAVLGRPDKAADFNAGVVDSESGKLEATRALLIEPAGVEAELKAVDALVKSGSLDQVRNALETCAHLFDRFYGDVEKRGQAEQRVRTAYQKLPLSIRVELLTELAGFALAHRDPAKALDLVDAAQLIVDGAQWSPEQRIPIIARFAGLRFEAGDRDRCRRDAADALASFEANREKIVDIYRAGALRPLAETYRVMGDAAAALKVYTRVVEEGIKNPNSRPRAEDFSATCCSMALHAFQPDPTLRAQLNRVCDGLGQPW